MEVELTKLVEVVMVEVGLAPAATVEVVPVLAVMEEVVPEDMVVVVVTEDMVVVLMVVVVMAGLVLTVVQVVTEVVVVVPEATVEVIMAPMVWEVGSNVDNYGGDHKWTLKKMFNLFMPWIWFKYNIYEISLFPKFIFSTYFCYFYSLSNNSKNLNYSTFSYLFKFWDILYKF